METRKPIPGKEIFLAMGGIPVEIITLGIPLESLSEAVSAVEENVGAWESQLSLYKPDSLVNKIAVSPNNPIPVPKETWETLQDAKEAYEISNHVFDITVGDLVMLWKKAEQKQVLPNEEDIQTILKKTGFNKLVLDSSRQTVTWTPDSDTSEQPMLKIDIGGIAKGLFSQWICANLEKKLSSEDLKFAQKIIVNTGGDMFCKTFNPGTVCYIGIQDPFTKGGLWGTLHISAGAVVTSGTYERFFDINGTHYCHILDPRIGRPIETNLVSVTITDPSGAMADALATTVFVLGEEAGWKLIESRPQTEMILIRLDGSYRATQGIVNKLELASQNLS